MGKEYVMSEIVQSVDSNLAFNPCSVGFGMASMRFLAAADL